jgi:hypothetical protein
VVDDMRLELERIVAEELRKSYVNQVTNKLLNFSVSSYLKGFLARFCSARERPHWIDLYFLVINRYK